MSLTKPPSFGAEIDPSVAKARLRLCCRSLNPMYILHVSLQGRTETSAMCFSDTHPARVSPTITCRRRRINSGSVSALTSDRRKKWTFDHYASLVSHSDEKAQKSENQNVGNKFNTGGGGEFSPARSQRILHPYVTPQIPGTVARQQRSSAARAVVGWNVRHARCNMGRETQ